MTQQMSKKAREMRKAYDHFSAVYWTDVIKPSMDQWIEDGQPEEGRPDIVVLMEQSHQFAWEKLAEIYSPTS